MICIKNFKLRKVFSKFRLSSHCLNIEKGRHVKPKLPIEARLCNTCKQVEDEEHLLLHCKGFINERVTFFVNLLAVDCSFLNGNPSDVFIRLMSSDDEKIIFNICRFLQICFKILH